MKDHNDREPLEFDKMQDTFPSTNPVYNFSDSILSRRRFHQPQKLDVENEARPGLTKVDTNAKSQKDKIEIESPSSPSDSDNSFEERFKMDTLETETSRKFFDIAARDFRETFNSFNSSSHSNPWPDLKSHFSRLGSSPLDRIDTIRSRFASFMEESPKDRPSVQVHMEDIKEEPAPAIAEEDSASEKNEEKIDEEEEIQAISHGFPNLGNTCYMNAVLQCLINSDIYNFIFEGKHLIGNPEDHPLTDSFAQVLCKAFTKKVDREDMEDSLHKFKKTLEKVAPIFKGYAQNDAHEFYRLLIEKIHDELNDAPKRKEPYSEFKPSRMAKNLTKIAEEWVKYSSARDHSIITEIFGGILLNEITCTNCNKVSYTFEDALDLPLNLPGSNGNHSSSDYGQVTSLYTALDHFVEGEDVEGYQCEGCRSRNTSMKRTTVWKAPEIFVVQFKRFVYNQYGDLDAIKDNVAFPVQNLSIEYFMHEESNENRNNYQLYGIVNHKGDLNSGHYTAYVYNERVERWIEYNDSRLSLVSSEDIYEHTHGSSEPYLLFYRRV